MMGQGSGVAAAIERARCLAELSTALDDAQRVLESIRVTAAQNPVVVELRQRIEDARFAIQSFRLDRSAAWSENSDPDWMKSLPWQRRLGDGD